MKVIDFEFFRNKKIIQELEKKMTSLALVPDVDAARKMKTCFKTWLEKIEVDKQKVA